MACTFLKRDGRPREVHRFAKAHIASSFNEMAGLTGPKAQTFRPTPSPVLRGEGFRTWENPALLLTRSVNKNRTSS